MKSQCMADTAESSQQTVNVQDRRYDVMETSPSNRRVADLLPRQEFYSALVQKVRGELWVCYQDLFLS